MTNKQEQIPTGDLYKGLVRIMKTLVKLLVDELFEIRPYAEKQGWKSKREEQIKALSDELKGYAFKITEQEHLEEKTDLVKDELKH